MVDWCALDASGVDLEAQTLNASICEPLRCSKISNYCIPVEVEAGMSRLPLFFSGALLNSSLPQGACSASRKFQISVLVPPLETLEDPTRTYARASRFRAHA
jgi:hypothetical protein